MRTLIRKLTVMQRTLSSEQWRLVRQAVVACDAARDVIHQDPITRHSFEKPRGYPGDAVLLDRLYDVDVAPDCGDAGRGVWEWTSNGAESVAVRERRGLLAGMIRDVIEKRGGQGSVLSIACGHLREAGDVNGFPGGFKIVALDQDAESLAEVKRSLPADVVTPVEGSVRTVLKGQLDGDGYDLVYAAGLYDYLSMPMARKLTAKMFELVRPSGKLLVANFAEDCDSTGYLQTFMDWHLIYRTQREVMSFADDLPRDASVERHVFSGENRHIHYLVCSRPG